jgi:hypothetical protein
MGAIAHKGRAFVLATLLSVVCAFILYAAGFEKRIKENMLGSLVWKLKKHHVTANIPRLQRA